MRPFKQRASGNDLYNTNEILPVLTNFRETGMSIGAEGHLDPLFDARQVAS